MGFDVYGLSPSDGTKPDEPHWENIGQKDEKTIAAYFTWQEHTPGAYFRANVWYWRPIWEYVCTYCDDILTTKDMDHGTFNDGWRICKTKAKKIAARLRRLKKDGSLEKHESMHESRMDSLPDEECHCCDGIGFRNDDIGIEARKKDPTYTCNGCSGKGTVKNFGSHYPFDSQYMIEFETFCENSGGFEIC